VRRFKLHPVLWLLGRDARFYDVYIYVKMLWLYSQTVEMIRWWSSHAKEEGLPDN